MPLLSASIAGATAGAVVLTDPEDRSMPEGLWLLAGVTLAGFVMGWAVVLGHWLSERKH